MTDNQNQNQSNKGEDENNIGGERIARRDKLPRTPPHGRSASMTSLPGSIYQQQDEPSVQNQTSTPMFGASSTRGGVDKNARRGGLQRGENIKGGLNEATEIINDMQEFVRSNFNVHQPIKKWVPQLMVMLQNAAKERAELIQKVEAIEKALREASMAAPKEKVSGPGTQRSAKRDRDSPGDSEQAKKRKDDPGNADEGENSGGGWQIAKTRRENKKTREKNDVKEPTKPKPTRVRSKGR